LFPHERKKIFFDSEFIFQRKLNFQRKQQTVKNGFSHRCTVVGNPGGDPWGFGQILLRRVLGVFRKSKGVSFFVFNYIL
jgi:hypothetical protein